MKRFKLGKLNKFNSKIERINPYDKFYRWIILKMYPLAKLMYGGREDNYYYIPHNKQIDVTKVIIHPDDDKEFMGLVKKWATKVLKHYPKKKIDVAVAMLHLDIAPRIDDKLTKKGYIIVQKGFLRKRNV